MSFKDNVEFKLAGRMIVKSHLVALAMENNFKLGDNQHTISEDIRDWGYYKNLAGLPHKFNSPIKFNLTTTNVEVILTREYLQDNKSIASYIKYTDGVLETLLSNNMKDNTYIMGMLYPTDMDTLVNAKDGTILQYEEQYVKYYEKDIILELEKYITTVIKKYSTPGFILSDNLYGSALQLLITQALSLKLVELRYTAQDSYMVSDRLMANRFNSILNLEKEVRYFSRDIRLWLYKNIKYLVENIGKHKTTNLILENVIIKLGLTVKDIIIKPTNMRRVVSDISKSNQLKDYDTLTVVPRDGHFGGKTSYSDVSTYETTSEYNDVKIKHTSDLIKMDKGVIEKSKYIVIGNGDGATTLFLDKEKIMLELLILKLLNNDGKSISITIDSKPNMYTYKEVLGLLFYYTQKIHGMDKEITSVNINNVMVKREPNVITDGVIFKEDMVIVYNNMISAVNNALTISDVSMYTGVDIENDIKSQLFSRELLLHHMSTYNDNVYRSNLDLFYKRYKANGTVSLPTNWVGKKISEVIIDMGINPGISHYENLKHIVVALTGLYIDESTMGKSFIDNVINFLNKMTSYTVNFLVDINNDYTTMLDYGIDIMDKVTILQINDFTYDCGNIKPSVTAYGDDEEKKITIVKNRNIKINIATDTTVPICSVDLVNGVKIKNNSVRTIRVVNV